MNEGGGGIPREKKGEGGVTMGVLGGGNEIVLDGGRGYDGVGACMVRRKLGGKGMWKDRGWAYVSCCVCFSLADERVERGFV